MSELTALSAAPYRRVSENPPPSRDRAEFERLARRLADPLKAVAVRYANPDLDLAEDLVQHALTAGYRLFLEGRFNPELGAYTWFSTAIRNEFFAHQRRQAHIDATPQGILAHLEAPCPEKNPYDVVAAPLLSGRLCEAMDELPFDQRACVELVDLAGLDYKVAAKLAGIPVGTLRSRLARARLKLASSLSDGEPKKP